MGKPTQIWISWSPELGHEEHDTMEEAARALSGSLDPSDGEWPAEAEHSCVMVAFKVLEAGKDTMPTRDGYDETFNLYTALADDLVKASRYPVSEPPAHEPRVVYYRDEDDEVRSCVVVRVEGETAVVAIPDATAFDRVAIDRIFHNDR